MRLERIQVLRMTLERIGEVSVPAQETWPAEHPLIGVLDEILGVLPRPAQSVRGPVEPVHMGRERVGVELPRRLGSRRLRAHSLDGGVRGSHSIDPEVILATERRSHIGQTHIYAAWLFRGI